MGSSSNSSRAVSLKSSTFFLQAQKVYQETHGADQFDEKDPKWLPQMSTYFNWLMLALCSGASVGLTLFVWIQDYKGWDKGFGMCAIAILAAIVVFSSGFPQYRMHVTRGSSAITELIQVYVAAVRNRKHKLPDNDVELYEINMDKEEALELEFLPHTKVFRWLDKAAVRTSTDIEHAAKLKNHLHILNYLSTIGFGYICSK